MTHDCCLPVTFARVRLALFLHSQLGVQRTAMKQEVVRDAGLWKYLLPGRYLSRLFEVSPRPRQLGRPGSDCRKPGRISDPDDCIVAGIHA